MTAINKSKMTAIDRIPQDQVLNCTPEKMDGSNIPPRLGVVPLTNGVIRNSDPSWKFIS